MSISAGQNKPPSSKTKVQLAENNISKQVVTQLGDVETALLALANVKQSSLAWSQFKVDR